MTYGQAIRSTVVLVLAAAHPGCTLIGLGAGAAIDGLTPTVEAVPGWSVTSLAYNDHVKVIRGDGQPVDGRFLSLDTLTNQERVECFPSLVSAQRTVGCPIVGDSITIRKRTLAELEVRGSLERMTIDRIEIMTDNGRRSIQRGDIIQITDPRGLIWRGDQVRDYFLLNSAIVLHAPDPVRIPLMHVKYLEHKRAKYAILVGGGLGLALDIIWTQSLKNGFKFH